MKIIIGILMLCIIVIAHEFGHMLVAKANHIEVKEFWVGFGPKLFSFTKGETEYALCLIPFGGACVFRDDREENQPEEQAEEDSENQDTPVDQGKPAEPVVKYDKHGRKLLLLNEAPALSRIATLIAGSAFNFILAFLMGLVVVAFSYIPSAKVADVSAGGPAQMAGICAGDEIIKINGSRVYLYPEVSLAIQTGVGKPLSVVFKRDGQKYKADIIPELNEEYGQYMIGVSFGGEDDLAPAGVGKTITGSVKYVRYMVKMTYLSLKMLLSGQASVKEMSGPVGVVSIVSDKYDAAAAISPLAIVVSMLNIAVLISANLGVLNLLPFPALDGGRLIFAVIELITGRKVDERVEGAVHFVGAALLLILMIVVLFNDMLRLFGI